MKFRPNMICTKFEQKKSRPGWQAPKIFRVITVHKLLNAGQLDTVVQLVVASQMMRHQAPQIFFPRNAPGYLAYCYAMHQGWKKPRFF